MSTSTDLQLSLADVARLAGVQRPVVSMWRRRERPESPFPEPVATVKGQERFDAAQIAAYLAATGRGKNDEAHADAAAYADTPTGADEQATLGFCRTLPSQPIRVRTLGAPPKATSGSAASRLLKVLPTAPKAAVSRPSFATNQR